MEHKPHIGQQPAWKLEGGEWVLEDREKWKYHPCGPFPQFWHLAREPQSATWYAAQAWGLSTMTWWFQAQINRGEQVPPEREEVAELLDWLEPEDWRNKFIDQIMLVIEKIFSFGADRPPPPGQTQLSI